MNLSEYLKGETARRSLSVRRAADNIGISHVTLLRILSGETPNLETLSKLSQWTHVDLAFLLELLGYHVQVKNEEMDRLARLVQYDPTYRRLFALVEKLGPEELEFAVDYLGYLSWRLGGQEQKPPALEGQGLQPEAGQEGQNSEPDLASQSTPPADIQVRGDG